MSFLQVQGKDIVKENGEKVYLRGVSFGGWLNMESFINGYIGAERTVRNIIKEELGEEKAEVFFRSLLDNYITEKDFAFLSEIGVTAIRVPFNYRHFTNDLEPEKFSKSGFKYLDRIIEWARKYNIYIILDLHAVSGWQSEGLHCDNPYNISLVWGDKAYQDRIKDLWGFIADYYKDEPQIAGYDILNEPNAPDIEVLNKLYRDVVKRIREVDKNHIIFLEGNNHGTVFTGFDEPFDDNLVYSSHNYTPMTSTGRRYPGPVVKKNPNAGSYYIDKQWIEDHLLERNKWIFDHNLPSWVGEFGAIFDGTATEPTPSDKERLRALKDQLEIFNKYEQHWTIWNYKDIGVMGLVVPDSKSEYIRRINPILNLKQELGLDAWTARYQGILYTESYNLLKLISREVAIHTKDYSIDYMGASQKQLCKHGLLGIVSDILAPLYAARFLDMTPGEIEKMHEEAFSFQNCVKREYLISVLKDALKAD